MALVTSDSKVGLHISYWDGQRQRYPFKGYHIEGCVAHVPEDNAPGWVNFDLEQTGTFQEVTAELARTLFCDFGFTAEQIAYMMEDF